MLGLGYKYTLYFEFYLSIIMHTVKYHPNIETEATLKRKYA